MKFNKHGSFYVRQSWPMKGLHAVKTNQSIFSPQNEAIAINELGLGSAMVRSLRYWLNAMKLVKEHKKRGSLIVHDFTDSANAILDNDAYCQTNGTMWLLHYNLATNREEATTWYWFFNEFDVNTFTKEEFIEKLNLFVIHNNEKVAESSLVRDFNCLRQTYLPQKVDNIAELIEEGILSYFSRLGFLTENKGVFMKHRAADNRIQPEIVYFCILDKFQPSDIRQISIEQLYEEKQSVGKVFNFSYKALLSVLEALENRGYIHLYTRFGHRHIELIEMEKDKVIKSYYRKELGR